MPNNPIYWEHFSLYEAFEYYNFEYGSTTHMTLIFNIFVFYALFNQFNCRIIDDSLNNFKRINKGYMFIIVTLFEMLVQILITDFGYGIFHCVYEGLSFYQWGICFGFSFSTFIFNFLIKKIPIESKHKSYINNKKINDEIKAISNFEVEMKNIFDIE